ncbi:MAG: DUF1116 domain-containing protein [Candidatus Rokubacteria bacterium]|nr:DUF1116 domain-containing protein [Candidatus Rokubacteria bacterium]
MSAVARANETALARLLAAEPVLVDVRPARDVLPGMTGRTILHAGPPIPWERMCGPMRGAVTGALRYERWAKSAEDAEALAGSGEIAYLPCHHAGAVGPMAGIISPAMSVLVVENRAHGNRAFATLNEGLGRVLRYGANDASVIARLGWMDEVLGPALGAAVRRIEGGLDLRSLLAQALSMGDEGHNRNRAGTSLFFRAVARPLLGSGLPRARLGEVFDFIGGNDHFFLNLSMAACKAALDAAHGVPGSSLVTAMARNGVEVGIRASGLGDRWFTGPAAVPEGLFFPGYGPADANPDIGDSAITETAGLGGFAMAAAPAIVEFVGGRAEDAVRATLEMYEITLAEHPHYRIPALGFRGTPAGIDVRKVVDTGILPVVNTGIAHRTPGVGQIGAGVVRPPLACFADALRALAAARAPSA